MKGQNHETSTFKNPIISGFHPDPSICRVGNDYYLVTSSFEWFPGIPVFHSKDLMHWQQIGYVLNRPSQLQMKDGLRHSNGLWAPTIRYHQGKFYVICTAQQAGGNFYVTADKPEGPYSEPMLRVSTHLSFLMKMALVGIRAPSMTHRNRTNT
jgi:xylan 1,4-beta-xylosidase